MKRRNGMYSILNRLEDTFNYQQRWQTVYFAGVEKGSNGNRLLNNSPSSIGFHLTQSTSNKTIKAIMNFTFSKLYKALLPHGFMLYSRNRDIKKYAVKPINLTFFNNQQAGFYSQTGEDILLRLFCEREEGYKGFYIDIGAFDPTLLSNTKYFYDKGWSGINIDANPVSIAAFNKVRTRDINIHSGVSDSFGELDYYYFGDQDSKNTFNKTQSEKFEKMYGAKVKEVMKVAVHPINNLLEKNLPEGQRIDFITIDVEGFEMRILKSFDFEKYAPDFFLVEDLEFANKRYAKFQKSPTCIFFKEKGYLPVAKTHMTILFKRTT